MPTKIIESERPTPSERERERGVELIGGGAAAAFSVDGGSNVWGGRR